jgi:hypothetical protein
MLSLRSLFESPGDDVETLERRAQSRPIAGLALAAICSLACLLSGCGSGGSKGDSSSTAATVSPARHAAACASAVAAEKRYLKAASEMGLQVLDRRLERPTRTAAEAFGRSLAELQQASAPADAARVAALAAPLSLQVKMFAAFDARKLPEAQKYGNELNTPLQESLAELPKVCPGAPVPG